MFEARRPRGGRAPLVWIVALGACTLWLVVQNAVLLAAVMWTDAETAARIVTALVKAGAVLIGRFWSTPAALAVLAGVITGLALRAQPAARRRAEVRHG
jgi:hypothetical protein